MKKALIIVSVLVVNKVENSVPNEVKPQVLPQITSTEVKPQVLPQVETIAVPAGKQLSASKIKLAKGFDLNVLSSELENIPSIIQL